MENNFEIHELKGHIIIPLHIILSGQPERFYFEKELKKAVKKDLEERNLHTESFEIVKSQAFETATLSVNKSIGYIITYKARKRNDDDDVREQIEYMIENLK